jgi:chromosome partitioning protein
VIKNTKLSKEIAQALQDYELPVFKSVTCQRVIYPQSATTGSSVIDSEPNGEASIEIKAIMQEVKEFL